MSIFSSSHSKKVGPDEIDALLESAYLQRGELKAEFAKRFSAQAAADALMQGTRVDDKARTELQSQIATCEAEIAGLDALRVEHLFQQKAERISKMKADLAELQKKQGELVRRSDALRTENDTVDAQIHHNFIQMQRFQAAIHNAEAAQQKVPG